jgi:hypothetical protein
MPLADIRFTHSRCIHRGWARAIHVGIKWGLEISVLRVGTDGVGAVLEALAV